MVRVVADASDARSASAEVELTTNELPRDWTVVGFADAVNLRHRFRVGKVKRENYLPIGRYPVIDQGQSAIAGYWNDRADLYDGPLPAIVFGDHTRAFKFVDFPFLCGADGTKVLVPNRDRFDPLFLYFAFTSLKIPPRGYNRHFAVLREQRLPCPPLPEQRAIARVLRTVQRAKEATMGVLDATHELRDSMVRYLFKYGAVPLDRAGSVVTRPIGSSEVPAHWSDHPLGAIAELRVGRTPSRTQRTYWEDGTIPWVTIGDLNGGAVTATKETVSDDAIREVFRGQVPEAGTLLLSFKLTMGKIGLLTMRAVHNEAIASVIPDESVVRKEYLRYLLPHLEYASRAGAYIMGKMMSKGKLEALQVPLPDLEEQQRIADDLAAVETKITRERDYLVALGSLFDALLRDLMTGQLRLGRGLGAA